jgi:hypothetical protein
MLLEALKAVLCLLFCVTTPQTSLPVPFLKAEAAVSLPKQASMTGALGNVVGTTLALWLPLLPVFLFVRHAINSRSPSRYFSNSHV